MEELAPFLFVGIIFVIVIAICFWDFEEEERICKHKGR